MSKTNTFENNQLAAEFNAGSGNYFVALFTSDPGETGSVAGEATYTSYARVAVALTSGGWTVSGSSVSNTAAVTFPAATGGSSTVSHFGIMTALTGGTMQRYGALTSSLAITSGVTPEFAAGALTVTED